MDMSGLPPFWLAYLSDPSDSGRIHSNIRQRWLSGTSSRQISHQLLVIPEVKGHCKNRGQLFDQHDFVSDI